ncbi:M16 family metallopeptidase [Microbacter margulisiae]|uniref:Zinc protease n=1 Tax=Microbacter margulisiae TaxID=1350067 RepID=A0A7W5H1J6_9PORP|nr:insulinase family protein [Microbacter margulisiae]MBB3186770.1 zinc protease [Microbacter margulisiae]
MNKFIYTLSVMLAFSVSIGIAQQLSLVPTDPQVRIGKLDNGLTYYIRHNNLPKNRADFYIVQKVGAILENDNQNGLAHFLEHMSFDGTENFPGKGIINFFEQHGVRFGENVNAYTSLDETVYNLTNVPTLHQGTIDSSLLVLHDWSHFVLLKGNAIDNERRVIMEEWRTRASASRRMWKEINSIIYAGSQYAKRDVIGDTAVILHCPYQALRDYYKKWYRPDLQGIIVVGDIDVDKTEAEIKQLFGSIPNPANQAKRIVYAIPDNEKPIVAIVTDPEATSSAIIIRYKHDPMPDSLKKTILGYVAQVRNSLISIMINNRFQDLAQQPNAPFTFALNEYGDITKSKDAFMFYMIPREGQYKEAFRVLMNEIEKIKRYGFTASEYERAKAEMLTQLQNQYNNRDKQETQTYVNEYIANFLNFDPIPGIAWEYKMTQALLPKLPLEILSQQAEKYITNSNILVSIQAPENEKSKLPTTGQVLDMMNAVKTAKLEPYKDSTIHKPLLSTIPKPGSIVKTIENKEMGTTEWILSNGIKVMLKPTNFKTDEIRLGAVAYGGLSLVPTDQLPSASVTCDVINSTGLGDFSPIDLNKLLAGKIANVSPAMNDYEESFSGYSSVKDFSTMMQMLYLYFVAPRKDFNAYKVFMNNMRTNLANAANNPNQAFNDSVVTMLYNHSPRKFVFHLSTLDKISLEQIMNIYRERFANPANFTFFLVGNINPDTIKTTVLTYLGGLTTSKKTETWKDQNIRFPNGKIESVFKREMETPKTSNFIFYHDKAKYTLPDILAAKILGNILTIRYTQSIREKNGGAYSVGVLGTVSRLPFPQTLLYMQFDTDPKLDAKMLGIIHQELQKIADNGPAAEDLTKVKDNLLKKHAEELEDNNWWISTLNSYYIPHINYVNNYNTIVDNITGKTIQDLAKQLITKMNRLEVVMQPK